MPPSLRVAVRTVTSPPDYAVEAAGASAWSARNQAQGLQARFDASGVQIGSLVDAAGSALVSMRLSAWGAAGDLVDVAPAQLVADGPRVDLRRGPVVEWYVNSPEGIEQGFTIEAAPASADPTAPVELRLALDTALHARLVGEGSGLGFVDDLGVERLAYSGLAAWDASGASLEARLSLAGDSVSLSVETCGATWPVTIDPMFALPTSKLTANHIEIGGLMGRSVALLGNLALVGMPLEDVAGVEEAGRAHLFERIGSTWTLKTSFRATVPGSSDIGAFDWFGFSVALGPDRLAIGSPNDSNGTLGAGSVYVFKLDGCCWFPEQRLMASDPTPNSAFGRAVSISGSTILIGAPKLGNVGAAYAFVRSGTVWSQQAKLLPSTPGPEPAGDFGRSVALSGETAAVGAPNSVTLGFVTGAVFTFERTGSTWSQSSRKSDLDLLYGYSVALSADTLVAASADSGANGPSADVFRRSGTSWLFEAKLIPSSPFQNAFYPSVGLAGDTLVLGWPATSPPTPGLLGVANVFTRTGTSWSAGTEIFSGELDDYFGGAVAVSGDTILIGAPSSELLTGPHRGAAHVFTGGGTSWNHQAKLIPPAGPDNFAHSVAISGDLAVVGLPQADPMGALDGGTAWVFERSGATWTPQQELAADWPSTPNSMQDSFGYSVAVSGDLIAVGAPVDDVDSFGVNVGSAYLFQWDGSQWNQVQRLTATNKATGDTFGWSVAMNDQWLLVGIPGKFGVGAVNAYDVSSGLAVEQAQLVPGGGAVGYSVALSGTTAAVGVPGYDYFALTNTGALYIYEWTGTVWQHQAILIASDRAAQDQMGKFVAISGNTAVSGAPDEDNAGGNAAGSAYVFVRNGPSWTEQAKLVATGGAANDRFGSAVAIADDVIAVGAPQDDHLNGSGLNEGSAYLFERSGSTWTEKSKLLMPGAQPQDGFGHSAAMLGNTLLVGALFDDEVTGVDAGSVTVYQVFDIDAPWTDLGFGLAGTNGIPRFVGTGSLLPGATGQTALSGAKPSSPCIQFISVSSTPVPFKQGTLVPVPPLLQVALVTSPEGAIVLNYTWPAGVPSNANLWFQYAIADSAAPVGVALSNALLATTP